MRWHLGSVPDSPDFIPGAEWKPLREPSIWLFQLIAAPIALVLALGIAALWILVFQLNELSSRAITNLFQQHLGLGLLLLLPLIAVHELIHMLVHPGAGKRRESILGAWPSRGLFYAHFDGELSRERFLAILLMPLIVISVVPLIIACFVPMHPWFAWFSFWNAAFACGDALASAMVLAQIPAGATIRNKGWRTYWRNSR